MQKTQLYIQGQRVDMSENPNITITDTLKNVKNIDKVFTEFSQTFSVPASKTNNKIFKHYYNSDIVGGFDSRIRATAEIELNSIPFKKGFIKLEGVDLRDNKPHTYRITFFGGTVTLKDTLGDDKLSILNTLTNLNQTYDATNVRDALQDDPATNDIIVPLITHTERLIYDSTTSDQTAGNLSFHTGHIKGVSYTELKYAIRLHSIIEAIQDKYTTLSFSNDFFVSTNEPYYNLFMWLHRKKGDVENLNDLNTSLINGWSVSESVSTRTKMLTSSVFNVYGYQDFYNEVKLTTVPNSSFSNVEYKILIYFNGNQVYSTGNITGAKSILKGDFFTDNGEGNYSAYVESNSNITFDTIQWAGEYEEPDYQQPSFFTYTLSNFVYLNTFEFDITQQIPDIKIIDFLSGLFKMFNLVAYVKGNQTQVTVKSLDNFYANPSANSPYDISKYIDVSSNQVNSALPYREINFKHEDTKTFLAEKHTQITGQNWGESQFKSTGENGEQLDGSIYKVKTPFAQMKYERLIDVNGGAVKGVQVGYFVDDNQEPYLGKPLLFYPIIRSSSTQIAFLNSPSSQTPLTTYNIPSNSVALSSATSSYNMNFNQEQNEWGALDGDNGFTNSLFEAYYKSAIVSLFSPKNRLTKVTAYLPLNILTNYTLADRFIINGKTYKINSIKTNLNTGKSEIELLNDI
tara:strand:+ start:1345 stop:3402 length:2058 start_codon:yes stop_codon:yes gene_type:complete